MRGRKGNAPRATLVREAELEQYVTRDVQSFTEEESLAVFENRLCSANVCQLLARNPRLTGFYSVRLALVAHRQTPQAQAVKLVHRLGTPLQ